MVLQVLCLHLAVLHFARRSVLKQNESAMPQLETTSSRVPRAPQVIGVDSASIAYRIGGISFGMVSDGDVRMRLDSELLDFSCPPENCDVNIQVALTEKIAVPRGEALFHSGGLWSLYEERDGFRFNFQRPFPGEGPYKSAWFDREFRQGRLELSRDFFDPEWSTYPLEYPLDEVLMIHRLAGGEGVEVHAVGVVDEDGRGHLFMGHSGAGKSTTARLWQKQKGVHILSDDRIILRVHQGKFWMYGTPWHGDAGISSACSAPLTKIYLLEHGKSNEIAPIRGSLAAAELFARCFVPRHCTEGLQFALTFLDRVAREIPCNIFRFVPEQGAVEAVRRARD